MFRNILGHMMDDGLAAMMMPRGMFNLQLRCYSAPFYSAYDTRKAHDLNNSGKILLPASALDTLVRMNIEYPMLFSLTNPSKPEAATHAGVLEFVAEEGRCYVPAWIMRQLGFTEEGSLVTIMYRSLPTATYAKFKPMSTDFLDLINPRAVLEMKLRNFACLSRGDRFSFEHNDRLIEVLVVETRPANAVCVVECDMNVEFDAPEGYVEPTRTTGAQPAITDPHMLELPPAVRAPLAVDAFIPFSSNGHRLDGKVKPGGSISQQLTPVASNSRLIPTSQRETNGGSSAASSVNTSYDMTASNITGTAGHPDLDYEPGTLTFHRDYMVPERITQLRAQKAQEEVDKQREANKARPTTSVRASRPESVSSTQSTSTSSKIIPFSGAGHALRCDCDLSLLYLFGDSSNSSHGNRVL